MNSLSGVTFPLSALVAALLGDGPILILCPATLTTQWQLELKDKLDDLAGRLVAEIDSTYLWGDITSLPAMTGTPHARASAGP